MAKGITIDKTKVLKYLGFNKLKQELTTDMDALIDSSIEEVLSECNPHIISSPEIAINNDGPSPKIGNIELKGEDIKEHLKDCNNLIIMGATLGIKMDSYTRKYETTNITKAVIVDAICNVLIEAVCDKEEDRLRALLKERNKYLTIRFSPGYGDLPIEIQGDLIRIIDGPRKIGLTVTDTNILIPRKSITAILGVADIEVKGKLAGCNHCVLKGKCNYRERGTTCFE